MSVRKTSLEDGKSVGNEVKPEKIVVVLPSNTHIIALVLAK